MQITRIRVHMTQEVVGRRRKKITLITLITLIRKKRDREE
jgi:hypothetical protein